MQLLWYPARSGVVPGPAGRAAPQLRLPSGQAMGAIQVNSFTRENLGLTMQRGVVTANILP